jgi:glycosyltransferase involved in cell wall biosynthesis
MEGKIQKKKRLTIAMVNCDWFDSFRTNPKNTREKLMRDNLNPDLNYFFVLSWSNSSYTTTQNNIYSVHAKVPIRLPHPILDIFTFFRLPYELLKSKVIPDIFLVYDFGYLPTGGLIKFLYRVFYKKKVEVVLCLNNIPTQYSGIRRFGFIKSLYSWFSERVGKWFIDKAFVINSTVERYLLDLGLKKKQISIFSMNTIKRDREYIEKSKKGIIREKYNIPKDANFIVSVGRLEVEKNHERMIEYISKIPNTYLVILGEGSLRSFLESKIEEFGVGDRVSMPGFISRENIWNYYQDADIFVLLSRVEALGVVFWEAMYMEVPVIGTDELGIMESLGKNGERGFVVSQKGDFIEFKKVFDRTMLKDDGYTKRLKEAKNFVIEQIKSEININTI